VIILTGYFIILDKNIKGEMAVRPIFSEYLKPSAFGINKLKSIIKKEINSTEEIPANSSE
jgi:hypothetical protein